jgi:hypothetical protein
MFLNSFKFPARSGQVEHCFLSRTFDRASYQSYCPNISCRLAGLAETWSNIEVRNVIRFLRLKGTFIANLLSCTVLTSCHGNTLGFGALPLITINRKLELVRRYNWEVLDHPPYIPDLAPSDFYLLGPLKKHLGWRRFATDGEVQQAVMSWLQALYTDFLYDGIHVLVYRWYKCFGKYGDCVEK